MSKLLQEYADDVVGRQYEQWVYPNPIADLDAWRKEGYIDEADPRRMQWAYWPASGYPQNLKILIAGCGSNQAAIFAHNNPKATVVGVDISTTSLAHENTLKEKHGLDNLTVHQLPVEEVSTLDQEFDLIISTGVLHHLANPEEGLRALTNVLHPDGVISLMLYAHYPRVGVRMFQSIFQELGLGQSPEDVALVKDTLRIVRPDHMLNLYTKSATDLNFDAGVVDTFLHRREQDYTVKDCLMLLENCGLVFQGWIENFLYHPEGLVPAEHPLHARIQALPEREMWHVMEMFLGRIFRHCFYASKPQRDEAAYKIRFDSDEFWHYVPVSRVEKVEQPDFDQNRPATIQRHYYPPMPISDLQARLFNSINGENTVRQCIEKSGLQGEPEHVEAFTLNFFRSMWRLGFLFFKIPGGQ